MDKQSKKVEVPPYLKISKWVIWTLYFFVVIGIISLVLRVLLLLFNANLSAGFAEFVANVSNDYMQPFRGLFPGQELESGSYLDVSAIFAIVVYLFILWGVYSLISYVQNKIDISVAEQEKQLAEIRHQKQLAAAKAQRAPAKKV